MVTHCVGGTEGRETGADDTDEACTQIIVFEQVHSRHLHQAQDSCIWCYWRQLQVVACHIPHPMRDADIMYAEVSASRLSALANMIGGVIKPANIARACCRPQATAKRRGRSDSNAKNGGIVRFFLPPMVKGRVGVHSQT